MAQNWEFKKKTNAQIRQRVKETATDGGVAGGKAKPEAASQLLFCAS